MQDHIRLTLFQVNCFYDDYQSKGLYYDELQIGSFSLYHTTFNTDYELHNCAESGVKLRYAEP